MSFNAISLPTALPYTYQGNILGDTATLSRLPNGNYVAILAERATPASPTTWSSVLLDANGAPIGARETIISNSTTVIAPPDDVLSVLPLSNGGYGIVYAQPGTPSGTAMVEWFSAAGVSQGAPQQLAGTPTPFNYLFADYNGVKDVAVTYANGHSLVVWHQPSVPFNVPGGPSAAPERVYVLEIDANHNPVGSPVLVNSPYSLPSGGTGLNLGTISATTLASGQTLVTWEHRATTSTSTGPTTSDNTDLRTIHARLLDANGAPTGSEFTLLTIDSLAYSYDTSNPVQPPFGTSLLNLQVEALSGGGFVAVWTAANGDTGLADLKVQTFTAAGAAVGTADVLVDDYPYSSAAGPTNVLGVGGIQLTALNNGGFAVGFPVSYPFNYTGPTPDDDGRVQLYDANGQRVGGVDLITGRDRDGNNISRFVDADYVLRPDGTALVIGSIIDDSSGSQVATAATQIVDFLSSVTSPTNGNDVVTLTAHDNFYGGRKGNDSISGEGGNDRLFGDAGDDTLVGGTGNDTLDGGPGSDTADFSAATSALSITLDVNGGAVVNAGAQGTDTLLRIEGLIGGSGGDSLTGNDAANLLSGMAGGDTLTGGFGSDTLIGGLGADSIAGSNDNDIILATHDDGNDTIEGGSGFDILDYSAVNGVVQINQLAGTTTGSAGNDTLLDVIEQIKGTAFNDVLSGGHGINVLDGEGGNDQFFGNNGDDLMRGGIGDDTFFFSTSDGNDTLLGGSGFDVLDYSTLAGVVQVNQLAGTTTGTANNDTLSDVFEMVLGTAFGDVLSGGHGINSLKGNGGDDQIFANNGDDYTSGGDGNDTITMGAGNDTHDFRNGEDVDTILDFTAGGTEDTITLTFYSGLGITTFTELQASGRLSTVSGHAELSLNGGDRIIFNNVASHTLLTAADFVLV